MFKKSMVLIVVMSLLVAGTVGLASGGCGSGQEELGPPAMGLTTPGSGLAHAELGSAGNGGGFFGGLLELALKGLISGATGEIGGDIMGLVLTELGWGDSKSADDTQALADMNQKLGQIQSALTQIEDNLDSLEKELQITEEEILANTNDPASAISQICTFTEQFAEICEGEGPGGVSPGDIKDFANQVENGFLLETAVTTIHDSIVPRTSARVSVLDNYTDLAINKLAGKSLTDCYTGLEQYFSQLLYYQTQGVNMVVEARNALAKAGAAQANGLSPSLFLNSYLKNTLAPEVECFTKNVYRLVLAQVDLAGTDSFLSAEAAKVLARAEFFRIQVLAEDHFGLRGTLIATQDLANSVIQLSASDKSGKTYTGTGTLRTIPGKTYDFWSGDTVKNVSDYTVIAYDFGDVPAGDYSVTLQLQEPTAGQPPRKAYTWSATARNYDSDYNATDSGGIVYGNMIMPIRVGAQERFASVSGPPPAAGPYWRSQSLGALQRVEIDIAPGSSEMSLQGGWPNNTSFSADAVNNAAFVFVGNAAATVTIDFSAQVTGAISPNGGEIYYRVGVVDGQGYDSPLASKNDSRQANSLPAHFDNPTQVNGTLSFTAQPQQSYTFFVEAKMQGSTSLLQSGSGRLAIRNVTANLTFK